MVLSSRWVERHELLRVRLALRTAQRSLRELRAARLLRRYDANQPRIPGREPGRRAMDGWWWRFAACTMGAAAAPACWRGLQAYWWALRRNDAGPGGSVGRVGRGSPRPDPRGAAARSRMAPDAQHLRGRRRADPRQPVGCPPSSHQAPGTRTGRTGDSARWSMCSDRTAG